MDGALNERAYPAGNLNKYKQIDSLRKADCEVTVRPVIGRSVLWSESGGKLGSGQSSTPGDLDSDKTVRL
jgi:hypothetical protein